MKEKGSILYLLHAGVIAKSAGEWRIEPLESYSSYSNGPFGANVRIYVTVHG